MNKIFPLMIFFTACFFQAVPSSAEQAASQIVSVQDYCSMLQAVAVHDPLQLYSDEMAAAPEDCGIIRTEVSEGYSYTMIPEMEDQPMKELSQSQQDYYFHWVEQGFLQGEEALSSPLMMVGEEKEGPEQAKKEVKEQQERKCQATDAEESDASSSEQRSQHSAAIKEGASSHRLPTEIHIGTPSDDISDMTGDYTTPESNQRSPSFSRMKDPSGALLQAQYKLSLAKNEVEEACRHFDCSKAQWEAFHNLSIASKKREEFQQRLDASFTNFKHAEMGLLQAQEAVHRAGNGNDLPSCEELHQAVEAAGKEVHRTFLEHHALDFQAQSAFQNYYAAQQRSEQQGLIPGVDYIPVFNEAQLRANRAADQLEKCEEAVRQIKINKPSTPKKKEAGVPSEKTTASVKRKQATATIETAFQRLEQLSEASEKSVSQQAESISKSPTVNLEKIFYEDKGTQISEEDLAAWNREALLKKQALWKSRFHKMVTKVKQLKEAVAADVSEQLFDEVSQKLMSNIAQTSLAEEQDAVAERKMALEPTIADTLIEEALSAKWAKAYFKKIAKQAERELFLEKKKKIFNDLFYSEGETTEREKWEQEQESAESIRRAREQQRAELKEFYTKRVNLLHPAEEAGEKKAADNVVPLIQRTRDILTQCYRRPYEWYSDTVQLAQDWKIIQAETGKQTEKFFADQGRSIADVPTTEYALKNGQVAQQLYNELIERRRQEEAAAKAAPGEHDPSKEIGYFEQMTLLFEGPVFRRFVTNFFEGKVRDFNRESDERAIDYFREIGKHEPRIFEFWKKSAEIEEQLKKERLEKAEWFLEQLPNEEERRCAAKAWGASWPERLQQEREQKENERLAKERLAQEAKRQSIMQAVMEQREAERQKIEKELVDQEAKEQVQQQGTKGKRSKR